MSSLQNPNEEGSSILTTYLVATGHKPSTLERETPNIAFLISF